MAIWIPALNLDCKKCSDSQKKLYGCEKNSPIKNMWEIGGYTLQRCPLTQIDFKVNEVFEYYRWYEKGFLPNPGGWREQAAMFVDVMGIIEREQIKVAEAKKKK